MLDKVGPACLGNEVLDTVAAHNGDALDLVGVALGFALHVSANVLVGLDDIANHIESVTGSLGDGQAVVQSKASGDGAEADNNAPHFVDRELADPSAVAHVLGRLERLAEGCSHDQSNYGSGKLANALHGKDCTHHGTAPFGSSEPNSLVRFPS